MMGWRWHIWSAWNNDGQMAIGEWQTGKIYRGANLWLLDSVDKRDTIQRDIF